MGPIQAPGAERNIEVVRQMYAAFGRADVETMLALMSADVEWGEPANPYNPAAGTRHGHQGFLEWLAIGKASEEILVLEPRRFFTDDDGAVAVVGFMRCRAKQTGRTYESDFVHVAMLEDGKITRFQEFFDTYAAGEAFRTDAVAPA